MKESVPRVILPHGYVGVHHSMRVHNETLTFVEVSLSQLGQPVFVDVIGDMKVAVSLLLRPQELCLVA